VLWRRALSSAQRSTSCENLAGCDHQFVLGSFNPAGGQIVSAAIQRPALPIAEHVRAPQPERHSRG